MGLLADAEQFLLALLTGIAFGAIEWIFWRASWSRVLMVLVALYFLQTFAQLAWRYLDGRSECSEFVTITALRLVFLVAAIVTTWALHARRER